MEINNKIDLHIHSNFSEDGDLSVEEIFKKAQSLSLTVISITDHDSIESIAVAKKIKENYTCDYIPGVEITTIFARDGSQQHILGYFIDEDNHDLIDALSYVHKCRVTIAQKRIEALKKIGFEIDEKRVWEQVSGRAPAATSLVEEVLRNEKNQADRRLTEYYTGTKSENRIPNFYIEYLMQGKAAYVPFVSISLPEGVEVIKRAGGIPVLAHPNFVKNREWLPEIIQCGIVGIEAFSSYHNEDDITFYKEFAKKHALLVTAGSDFHGPTTKPTVNMASCEGYTNKYFQQFIDYDKEKK